MSRAAGARVNCVHLHKASDRHSPCSQRSPIPVTDYVAAHPQRKSARPPPGGLHPSLDAAPALGVEQVLAPSGYGLGIEVSNACGTRGRPSHSSVLTSLEFHSRPADPLSAEMLKIVATFPRSTPVADDALAADQPLHQRERQRRRGRVGRREHVRRHRRVIEKHRVERRQATVTLRRPPGLWRELSTGPRASDPIRRHHTAARPIPTETEYHMSISIPATAHTIVLADQSAYDAGYAFGQLLGHLLVVALIIFAITGVIRFLIRRP
jgi:hypothetical protein